MRSPPCRTSRRGTWQQGGQEPRGGVRVTDEIAAMPDIAARHVAAVAERAAERAAARAGAGPQTHIEEPRRKAARPPLAPIVMKAAPVAAVAAVEQPVVAEQPEPVVEVASVELAVMESTAPVEPPVETAPAEVKAPTPPSKPYPRREREDGRGQDDRGGWGPPRRRDAESGPPARSTE